jgi:probable poly-beta-1,6-N-acetyl-D-glucosamine export protein
VYKQFVALSGFAMILILINHSSAFVIAIPPMLGDNAARGWQQDILIILQTFGILAVPIYFVISGSYLVYAFQGISKGKNTQVFMKFIWSNLARILWPYLIWSIIFYLVVYYFYNIRFNLLEYVKNLIVGYPYNFVPLLFFYYLISPILIQVGKRYPILMLVAILSYQVFLSNLVSPGLWGFVLPEWTSIFRPPIISGTMATWAIFFPIGIVYGLEKSRVIPWAIKYKRIFIAIFLLPLILSILDKISIINVPQASYIFPLAFVCLLPTIDRYSIPWVKSLEQIGKRSYGFYLAQIVILDLALYLVHVLAPGMFLFPIILAILCFLLVLFVPWGLMIQISRPPTNRIYAYFFG